MKILGYEFKKGEYQGHNFNNTILYLAYPIEKDGKGFKVDKCKCKTQIFSDFVESNHLFEKDILNVEIIAFYDKYGNITMIGKK